MLGGKFFGEIDPSAVYEIGFSLLIFIFFYFGLFEPQFHTCPSTTAGKTQFKNVSSP
jgi:hypothetical protein